MWLPFCINLSNTNIIDGNIVTTQINPIKTPFAITRPISVPIFNCIVHNAKNPAIVVKELPSTDTRVEFIAFAIASYMSLLVSFSFR